MIWRFPVSIVLWCLFVAFWVPLCVLGWIVIPLAVLFKAYGRRKSRFFDESASAMRKEILAFTWSWVDYIWGNDEDGIAAGRQYKDLGAEWKQIIYWSAFRNPVNNIRFVPFLSVKLDKNKINFRGSFDDEIPERGVGNFPGIETWAQRYRAVVEKYDTPIPQWFFAWQGLYSNFYWQFKMGKSLWRFWIGWKIYPTDVFGISPNSYRAPGAGFAQQLKRVKA